MEREEQKMLKIGDRVKFCPEFIAAIYKKAINQEGAENIHTVVDVRMKSYSIASELSKILPSDDPLVKFLRSANDVNEAKEEMPLVLIGNLYPEEEILIKWLDGEHVWLSASYFELVF